MAEEKIPKEISSRIGRSFALLFNRAAMYNISHPFTVQSIADFFKNAHQGLAISTPVVVLMHQDQFFIEEEPLDPRLNTSKMLMHFKKAGIQSVSFEKSMQEDDLKTFTEIFTNVARFLNADSMKDALSQKGVTSIKINHVFFKKVTADDEIVDRRVLKQQTAGKPSGGGGGPAHSAALNIVAESVLMGELEKSLSIANLIKNPSQISSAILNQDLAESKKENGESSGSGGFILQHLQKIGQEVDKAATGEKQTSLVELADAIFDMKRNLIKGLEAQKATGITFVNEEEILEESNQITDKILIQLIRDEYKKGQISVQRLGQILRRLVPEPKELQRLMPKIKSALMEEGMDIADFLQLTQELRKELQSEGLAKVLARSAEDIGVSGEDLIDEINVDPTAAAELIYLASEIRKGTGDEKALSDLLVNYIENVGSKMALDAAEQIGEEGDQHLKSVISQVESKLVNQLTQKDIDQKVINDVSDKLDQRFDQCLNKLKDDWTAGKLSKVGATGEGDSKSVLRIFEESVGDNAELKSILDRVRTTVDEKGIDENNFEQIHQEISKNKPTRQKKEVKPMATEPDIVTAKPGFPKGVLNRKSTLYFIGKEISRSIRYDTPFSAIVFSILKVTPQKPVPKGAITRNDIINVALGDMAKAFRDTDIVGTLDNKKIIAILPMTKEMESKIAMRRILRQIHAEPIEINAIPLSVQFAGVVTIFDKDRTPTLKDFIRRAETDIFEMIERLRNVQTIY